MLICKSRDFAKCAESTFCSLALPGFGNVVVSWDGERDGNGVTSTSRRKGGSNMSFFLYQSIENWLRLMSDIFSGFVTSQPSRRWVNCRAVTALQ